MPAPTSPPYRTAVMVSVRQQIQSTHQVAVMISLLFFFFNILSWKLNLWLDFFAVRCMQPAPTSPLWCFFLFFLFLLLLFSNCLSAFLFHVCPFSSLLSFPSAVSLPTFLFHLLFICLWSPGSHSTSPHLPTTKKKYILTFSQEPTDPTSPEACWSSGHSKSDENTPRLWGRQGWPAGLGLPALPTLWAHAALLHR